MELTLKSKNRRVIIKKTDDGLNRFLLVRLIGQKEDFSLFKNSSMRWTIQNKKGLHKILVTQLLIHDDVVEMMCMSMHRMNTIKINKQPQSDR